MVLAYLQLLTSILFSHRSICTLMLGTGSILVSSTEFPRGTSLILTGTGSEEYQDSFWEYNSGLIYDMQILKR